MKIEVVNRTKIRVVSQRLIRSVQKSISLLQRERLWKKQYQVLALVLIPNRESRALNVRFRKKARPTNVLSFDYGTVAEIILAPGVIRNEARRSGQGFGPALLAFVLHGLLHLAGLHHEKSAKMAQKVSYLEQRLFPRVAGAFGARMRSSARRSGPRS